MMKPSWYSITNRDEAIAPDEVRFFAKGMKATITELDASHVSMLSQSKAVAAVIIDAAGNAGVASNVKADGRNSTTHPDQGTHLNEEIQGGDPTPLKCTSFSESCKEF